MRTRFYDSAEPGPPHGWLNTDQEMSATKKLAWENTISVVLQVSRRLADSLRGGESSQLLWGCLHAGGPWWIYHVLPAGEDRFGRPGRTLSVLFCSDTKEGFDWEVISAVAPEMEALVRNRNYLRSLLGRIASPSSGTLIDSLLKRPAISCHEILKSELTGSLDRLGAGEYEYFTISADGTVSNRSREDFLPKQLPPSTTPTPASEQALTKKPLSDHSLPMKIFTHFICLSVGLLMGYGAQQFLVKKDVAEKPKQQKFIVSSNAQAIKNLQMVIDYLNSKEMEGSDRVSKQTLPQGRPQNFQN